MDGSKIITISDKPTAPQPSSTNSWSEVLPKLKLIDDSVSNVLKIAGIISLGIGGLIFLTYYWSIGFMPEMDVKALVTFLATSFFTAVALLFAFIVCSFMPFVLWKIIMQGSSYERLQMLWHKDKKFAPKHVLLWLVLPFILNIGYMLFISYAFDWSRINIHLVMVSFLIIPLITSLIVLLPWKKLPNKPPDELKWSIAWYLFLGLLFGFFGIVISLNTLRLFLAGQNLGEIQISLLCLVVFTWNLAMILNILKVSLWQHLLISLAITFYIFSYSNQLTLLPNRIMNIYQFGNLLDTSLVLDETGCSIAQNYGVKPTPHTLNLPTSTPPNAPTSTSPNAPTSTPPNPPTSTPPNPPKITCFLSKVTILSRLGSTYYLMAFRNDETSVHFTMPGQNVLSWSVKKSK